MRRAVTWSVLGATAALFAAVVWCWTVSSGFAGATPGKQDAAAAFQAQSAPSDADGTHSGGLPAGRKGETRAGELPSPQSGYTPERIAAAIRGLGSDSWRERGAASDVLWRAGWAAEAALLEAAKSKDAETATRAEAVLERIHAAITPETPEPLREKLTEYLHAEQAEKVAIVEALLTAGPPGIRAVLILGRTEKDAGVRVVIGRLAARNAQSVAPAILREGDANDAAEILEAGALAGNEACIRQYVALAWLRGEADARARQHAERRDPADRRILAYLLRAKGDVAGAVRAAREANDEPFLGEFQSEAGDWPALAERMERKLAGENLGPATLSRLAAYQRLARSRLKFERTIETIRSRGREAKQDAWPYARALLLNDRPREAVELCIECGLNDNAFELLSAQHRYEEAFALAERVRRGPDGPAALAPETVCLLLRLGEREKAGEVLRTLTGDANGGVNLRGLRRLVWMENASGMKQDADAHAAEAIRLDPNCEREFILELFQDYQGIFWWDVLSHEKGDKVLKWQLASVRSILEGTMPPERLRGVFALADQIPKDGKPSCGVEIFMVFAAEMAGLLEEEEKHHRKWAEQSAGGLAEAAYGDWLAEQKRWKEAARQYETSYQKNPGSVVLFLQGHALSQSGDAARGGKLMAQADLALLDGVAERRALAGQMEALGLREQAARQWGLVGRLGPLDSYDIQVAGSQHAAREAAERKEYQQGGSQLEMSRVWLANSGVVYPQGEPYLLLIRDVHVMLLHAAIQKRDWERAVAEAELCRQALPADTAAAIVAIPELDRAGRKADAERIFAAAWELNEKNCRLYPRLAKQLNETAALAAGCRRKLDEALVLAQKAVEMEKDNPVFLDTLAEVHFQRGDRAKAVELSRKCIELNTALQAKAAAATRPAVAASAEFLAKKGLYYQRQAKRFESGEAGSKAE